MPRWISKQDIRHGDIVLREDIVTQEYYIEDREVEDLIEKQQIEESAAYEWYQAEQEYEKSLLDTRATTHGSFKDNSRYVQFTKDLARSTINWNGLEEYQKEAIDMTIHKLGRILTGDTKFIDSWRDIVGYNQLVVDLLEKDADASDVRNVKMFNIDGVWHDESSR